MPLAIVVQVLQVVRQAVLQAVHLRIGRPVRHSTVQAAAILLRHSNRRLRVRHRAEFQAAVRRQAT